MTGIDLHKLGFKSGIEIHQRLATSQKLFCHCPTKISEDAKPDGALTRKLRAAAGELGKVDPAAAFEASRKKTFEYQLFSENTCLVEQDEEPPTPLNPEALRCALVVAKILNAKPLDEVHVMRKTVADGSAVSAFQRTALVAVNGYLETPKGRVEIPTVCLEEESSGIVERTEGKVVYRLDRLGIPLVEIATDASLKDGSHVRETAEKIGLLLRSTGFVQRGIGSIRQDINVSIREGARVEIKGAQQLEDLKALAENEALRQEKLAEIRDELQRRGMKGVAFGKPHGVSHIFAKAKPFLSKPLQEGAMALAIKLLFCKGLIGKEIMPGHRFGTELSDYAKAKTGINGLVHCDEDPQKYGLTKEDFDAISKELDCIEDDGWAVVVADETTAIRALRAAFERCFTLEIPNETRRAEGMTSKFMRPLPGAARMYPETDVMPVCVTAEEWAALQLPKTTDERKKEYLSLGLGEEMAEKLVRSQEWEMFEQLSGTANPKTVAWVLLDVKPSLRRQGMDAIETEKLTEVLALEKAGKITKAAISDLLALASKEKEVGAERLAEAANLTRITGSKLKALAESLGSFNEVMKRHRLRVDAGELKEIFAGKGG